MRHLLSRWCTVNLLKFVQILHIFKQQILNLSENDFLQNSSAPAKHVFDIGPVSNIAPLKKIYSSHIYWWQKCIYLDPPFGCQISAPGSVFWWLRGSNFIPDWRIQVNKKTLQATLRLCTNTRIFHKRRWHRWKRSWIHRGVSAGP